MPRHQLALIFQAHGHFRLRVRAAGDGEEMTGLIDQRLQQLGAGDAARKEMMDAITEQAVKAIGGVRIG
jgi:hypothetical protein